MENDFDECSTSSAFEARKASGFYEAVVAQLRLAYSTSIKELKKSVTGAVEAMEASELSKKAPGDGWGSRLGAAAKIMEYESQMKFICRN